MRRALRLARRLMPSDGNLEGLVRNVGLHRGRPVLLQEMSVPGVSSGLVVAFDHADCILVAKTSGPSRRDAIVCHEVAHLLLEHTGDTATSDLLADLAPNLSADLVARMLARHAYDTPEEREAETMATMLVAERRKRALATEHVSTGTSTSRME